MEKKLTKKQKLDIAYQDLLDGHTLYYGDGEFSCVYIFESRQRPYKRLIGWENYGRAAESLSKKNFKWILDTIFEEEDYLNYHIK